jgi:pyruvate,orthophosphate dikinase
MSNNKDIYYFSKTEFPKNYDTSKIGIRGKRAIELAQLKMPILPGLIINSNIASKIESEQLNITASYNDFIKQVEKETGKSFNSKTNPATLKLVISPSLEIVDFPSIHNVGLTDVTIEGFKENVGETFAYHEYAKILIKSVIVLYIRKYSSATEKIEPLNKFLDKINKANNVDEYKNIIKEAKTIFTKEFFEDANYQLDFLIRSISIFLNSEEMDDDDTAILIQPMVYGNYGKDSYSGKFFTRDIITGDKIIQGKFFQNQFDDKNSTDKENSIETIDKKYKSQFDKIADEIECYFKEIREIKFTIEQGKLWIIEQSSVMTKSTQAELKSLLYLLSKKIVDEKYVINKIQPHQVSDILHPIINPNSIKKFKSIDNGIAGAPGAAIGKVIFNTEDLLEAHKKAVSQEHDKHFILCLPATYAGDVKAIEVATGVLSSEGGYSAHASVVARQYGKVSLVNPDIVIDTKKKQFTINGITVKEGDYITLDVPYYGTPRILLGKADLIEPDPNKSGLMDLINIINKYVTTFKVLGNGDTPKDAATIKLFGGEGIGLCRTEHMFFAEERINIFREMIISNDIKDRIKALAKLGKFQTKDFYEIFKTMHPYPVTIRLLDAPLHEFLPHDDDEMNIFMEYIKKINPSITKAEVSLKCQSISEINPMLGHRGCRIAVSYPEIYEMQVQAIFEAAYKLKEEGIDVEPEIMIPIVMNQEEVKFIKFGKKIEGKFIKGIQQVEQETREKLQIKSQINYKVGTMIELPSAVLVSDEIAKYAEFFSFGTNDLTQTTHGLSRDDFNSFMPDYSEFDLINSNPFKVLTEPVKELIAISCERGRMTRPDLKIGLCGEQGAEPKNLKFLKEVGVDYISCSSFSIPIAKLKIAQMELEN